jgi:hypothetical protein
MIWQPDLDCYNFEIRLYKGVWKETPYQYRLLPCVRGSAWVESLEELSFEYNNMEECWVACVTLITSVDPETVKDCIYESLLRRFVPEFETMIEVEQVCTI